MRFCSKARSAPAKQPSPARCCEPPAPTRRWKCRARPLPWCKTYHGATLTLHHFDLWRLDGAAQLDELGWDEARRDAVIVEWPDRLGLLAPADALTVRLDIVGETTRQATLIGWHARLRAACIAGESSNIGSSIT